MSQWTVWLPGAWPSYRDFHKKRQHWAAVHQLKQSWQQPAALLIKAARVPHMDAVSLTYLHRRKNRAFDKGNLAFGASKIIEDALQDAGVIDDDRWNYIADFAHHFEVAKPEGVLLTIRAA